mmetsp:Transcript_5660/g.11314  ORF Transcript_5660/g.11314 Transcript_5660/m.11314 type:complete len:110 (-) Transcript_5660:471-800(-)
MSSHAVDDMTRQCGRAECGMMSLFPGVSPSRWRWVVFMDGRHTLTDLVHEVRVGTRMVSVLGRRAQRGKFRAKGLSHTVPLCVHDGDPGESRANKLWAGSARHVVSYGV